MPNFSIHDSKINEAGVCLQFPSPVCWLELIGCFAVWSGSNLGIKCMNFKYYIWDVTTQFSRSDYCSGKTTSQPPPHLDLHSRRKSLRNTSVCSPSPAQKLHTLILSTYRNCSTLNELSKKEAAGRFFLHFSRETSFCFMPSTLRSS